MSLTLYFHPLSGFCQKVLVALYENETPFTPLVATPPRWKSTVPSQPPSARCTNSTRWRK